MTIDKGKAVEAQRIAIVPPMLGFNNRDLLSADQLRELFEELSRQNAWHLGGRKNVAQTEHGVRICHGDHERNEPCEWVDYVAASKHAEIEAERDRYKAALEFIASSSNCGTCDACLMAAKDALKP